MVWKSSLKDETTLPDNHKYAVAMLSVSVKSRLLITLLINEVELVT